MVRRPPRSTQGVSSAASDVYKRQISYGDPVAAVKIATDFIKDLPKDRKFFEIKTGVLDGKVLSLEEVKTLSETPSREELLARLARAFNSPIQGFVNVCAGPLRNFVNVINAVKDQKEAQYFKLKNKLQ
eukprot:TRINITY_DN30059_c0_g1_i3.p1 TRINITY_DN30059_c0_g1~~TRINITY_DN30059_c0_g1_i3.p1  ORF type:complete len:129 (-),score=27.59 TRINITY_DN30059_c0_g1_i3:172-558(-)